MPKSSKYRKSTSARPLDKAASKSRRPFTPIRRFFFKLELLKSPSVPAVLGKRRRDELPEAEAGFEHLHPYDRSSAVDKALESQKENADHGSRPIQVYADDGSRAWTRRPIGPRSHGAQHQDIPVSHDATAEGSTRQPASCSTPRSTHCPLRPRTARLALQNIDSALDDDAVIITALENIPFCCHEDLLAMSRDELVCVAKDLNAKLPKALYIDIDDCRPSSFIRNAIEVLVGICPKVPGAPLRVGRMKMQEDINPHFLEEFSFEKKLEESDNWSPSASPLSRRGRTGDWSVDLQNMLSNPKRLERLDEETEEDIEREGSLGRKRRRLSSDREGDPKPDSDIDMRSLSEDASVLSQASISHNDTNRKVPIQTEAAENARPIPRRVLRSHSRNMVEGTHDVATVADLERRTLTRSSHGKKSKRKCRETKNKPLPTAVNNSIAFPTIASAPQIHEQSTGSESSSDPLAQILTDTSKLTDSQNESVSSSMSKSLPHSEDASAESRDSTTPFMSVKSTLSSVSKMSIDSLPSTRSGRTRISTQSSVFRSHVQGSQEGGREMLTGDSGGTIYMDVSF
ncbi:hypothetical protein AX17_007496 [Amanita inopinata Kibby_2008]|nr:hypothetical protein AX17_007496 [Amanita inopinata Kibby_2008]